SPRMYVSIVGEGRRTGAFSSLPIGSTLFACGRKSEKANDVFDDDSQADMSLTGGVCFTSGRKRESANFTSVLPASTQAGELRRSTPSCLCLCLCRLSARRLPLGVASRG